MTMKWSDVSFTLDGVEMPAGDVSIERNEPWTTGAPLTPRTYKASCEMTISAEDSRRLLDAITPPIRGATDHTLAKRVAYGGRKGRSAWRRLRAKGFIGIAWFNGLGPIALPPVTVTRRKPMSVPNGGAT